MIDSMRRLIYISCIGVFGMIMVSFSYFFDYLPAEFTNENSEDIEYFDEDYEDDEDEIEEEGETYTNDEEDENKKLLTI